VRSLFSQEFLFLVFQPQNLVMMGSFPNSDVKLCDFEISRVILEGTEVREILGTPDYVGKSHSPVAYYLYGANPCTKQYS